MSRKTLLISPADSNIYEFFERQFNVISSDYLECFISFERNHADMQALKIKDKLFINADCKALIRDLEKRNISFTICQGIGSKYPDNVALNAAFIGNKLICKESALHPIVKDYCKSENIEIINVNQGYAKCSALIIDENSIITDDESIANASKKAGIDVMKIEKGDIYLDDKNYGFIGGSSAVIGDSVYFFGDINSHINADKIKAFIEKRQLNIICTGTHNLIDIGGVISLD